MSGLPLWITLGLLSVFALAQIIAMAEDARSMTISNWLSILLALCFILLALLSPWSWTEIALRLGIAVVIFTLFALAFYKGMIGGGDVKFLSASIPWVAPMDVMVYLFVIALAGGLLALAILIIRKLPGQPLPNFIKALPWAARGTSDGAQEEGIPYGIAIGLAGLWAVSQSATFAPLRALVS